MLKIICLVFFVGATNGLYISDDDLDKSAIFVSFPEGVSCSKVRFPTYKKSPKGGDYFYRCTFGYATEYRCPLGHLFDFEKHRCTELAVRTSNQIINGEALDDWMMADPNRQLSQSSDRNDEVKSEERDWLFGLLQDEDRTKMAKTIDDNKIYSSDASDASWQQVLNNNKISNTNTLHSVTDQNNDSSEEDNFDFYTDDEDGDDADDDNDSSEENNDNNGEEIQILQGLNGRILEIQRKLIQVDEVLLVNDEAEINVISIQELLIKNGAGGNLDVDAERKIIADPNVGLMLGDKTSRTINDYEAIEKLLLASNDDLPTASEDDQLNDELYKVLTSNRDPAKDLNPLDSDGFTENMRTREQSRKWYQDLSKLAQALNFWVA